MPDDSQQDNPFASPQVVEDLAPQEGVEPSERERLRRQYLNHEAWIATVGLIFYVFTVLAGLYTLSTLVGLAFVYLYGAGSTGMGLQIGMTVFASVVSGITFGLGYIGYGLRTQKPFIWGWALAFSLLGVFIVPIGPVVTVLIWYLLLCKKGRYVMSREYQQLRAATPQVRYGARPVLIAFAVLVGLIVLQSGWYLAGLRPP